MHPQHNSFPFSFMWMPLQTIKPWVKHKDHQSERSKWGTAGNSKNGAGLALIARGPSKCEQHKCACMHECMSDHAFISPFIIQSVSQSVSQLVGRSVGLSACLSVCLSVCLRLSNVSIYPSIHPSIHQSIHPSIHPSMHLPIYLIFASRIYAATYPSMYIHGINVSPGHSH